MQTALWLVKNGVPYDIAMTLDDAERLAYAVIFGQFEGSVFDWTRGQWKERPT